jgi:toxin HigB-1
MIRSFKDKGLERFSTKGDASKLSVQQRNDRINRILGALDAATTPNDVNLPGWKFHELTGDRKGTYSLSVSGNWRITFRMPAKDVIDVDLEDYH